MPEYIGRFAPSPTGALHFGSLVAAVASFVDAKAHKGKWLVRIEDIDPPRVVPGAADEILHSLAAHHLTHDGTVLFQQDRLENYQSTLNRLIAKGLVYPCTCSRQTLKRLHGIYKGHCLRHPPQKNRPHALRVRTAPTHLSPETGLPLQPHISFNDIFYGLQQQDIDKEVGDFILKRKDGLFAYQLAVVVDDIHQGITHVIRGSDLLSSTARQLFLFGLLGAAAPEYGHIPLVRNDAGQKLSKQNKAQPVNNHTPSTNLFEALRFLRQNPPDYLQHESPENILGWASLNWQRENLACKNHEN